MKTATDRKLLETVREGFRRVGLNFPYLAGLIEKIQVTFDDRIGAMGIFASGRLAINPDFVRSLSPQDLMFVLAHELYHLTLRTHQRGEGTDAFAFNCAHDYIINDMLRAELQMPIPAGGLDKRDARHLSAEKLYAELHHPDAYRPPSCWNGSSAGRQPQGEGEGDGEGEGQSPPGDVLDGDLENEWFPDTTAEQQKAREQEVEKLAARATSLQALMESMAGRGAEAGKRQESVAALRGLYRPPCELALQRWLDSVAPGERSYARPSRRGADRTDVVLPGRKREGWTMHVVLDTSGSMVQEVPRALGLIADFCEAVGVDRIHLIQCDTEVGSDEILSPAEVGEWHVSGFGGSNLTPAMQRLAEDREVAAAIVLTDGDIEYPNEPMPYNVLWLLPAWKNPTEFTPRYGQVVALTPA